MLDSKKIDLTLLLECSMFITVLYVEDDAIVRELNQVMLHNFFKHIDIAENGEEGLNKFIEYKQKNNKNYDLVISDINMPVKNGIEMAKDIMKLDSLQGFIFVTGHNENDYLMDAINIGVSAFLIKPLEYEHLKNTFYRVIHNISDRKKIIEQNIIIKKDKELLEKKMILLKKQIHTIDTKNIQVEQLLEEGLNKSSHISEQNKLLEKYFLKNNAKDVFFTQKDVQEINNNLSKVDEIIYKCIENKDVKYINILIESLKNISNSLYNYTPYLDPIAVGFSSLVDVIESNTDRFSDILFQSGEGMIAMFDAVSNDIQKHLERFSNETMAIKNIYQIHSPTVLSINQIKNFFVIKDTES